jgi:hypothetical protein
MQIYVEEIVKLLKIIVNIIFAQNESGEKGLFNINAAHQHLSGDRADINK